MALINEKNINPAVDANGGILDVNQIQLETRATAPTDANLADGRMYYDSAQGNFYGYVSGSWGILGGGGGTSGYSGYSGFSGISGYSGSNGTSGYSGYSGSAGSTNVIANNAAVGGGTYPFLLAVTTQTVAQATLTVPDMAGVSSNFVFDTLVQTLTNKTLTTPKITTIRDTNNNPYLTVSATSTAVDYFQITNAATANPSTVDLAAIGGSTNINLSLTPKGNGNIVLAGATTNLKLSATGLGILDNNGNKQLVFTTTATAVDYFTMTNAAAAGHTVALGAAGNDTDISINLVPKGAGTIQINGYALSLAAAITHSGAYAVTIAASAAVTVNLPGVSGLTLATITGTEVLTNKTLTTPTLTTPVANGLKVAVNARTTAYTATATDFFMPCDATGGAFALTLPAATGSGQVLFIKKTDASANAVTITRAGSDTIQGATTVALSTQYTSRTIVDGASGTWFILGAD